MVHVDIELLKVLGLCTIDVPATVGRPNGLTVPSDFNAFDMSVLASVPLIGPSNGLVSIPARLDHCHFMPHSDSHMTGSWMYFTGTHGYIYIYP